MTIEAILWDGILWVLGICIPLGLAWMVALTWYIRDMKNKIDTLHEMHKDPTKYDLGFSPAEKKLDSIYAVLKQLVHYVRWSAEQTSGKEPPPPPPTV